jgi:RimJ/RimL family protein N-acetyltransferase
MAPEPTASPPFLLRELRWEDFPARVESYLSLYEEVKENPDLGMTLTATVPGRAEEAAWFADLYRRTLQGDTIVVVGEMDGRAVGMVTIARTRFGGADSEAGHVGTLGILVDRGYRGKGLGAALMVRALELAKEHFEIVRLVVFSVNVRAKRLYERLGFRTTGRLEREVKRGGRYLDEEMMTLDLDGWTPPKGLSSP